MNKAINELPKMSQFFYSVGNKWSDIFDDDAGLFWMIFTISALFLGILCGTFAESAEYPMFVLWAVYGPIAGAIGHFLLGAGIFLVLGAVQQLITFVTANKLDINIIEMIFGVGMSDLMDTHYHCIVMGMMNTIFWLWLLVVAMCTVPWLGISAAVLVGLLLLARKVFLVYYDLNQRLSKKE